MDNEYSVLNDIQQRLYNLGEQRLLPKIHLEYLQSIKHIEPEVIYDIGSCVLHWSREAVNVWPNANFVCFEAMREVDFLYDMHGFHQYYVGNPLSSVDFEPAIFNQNLYHPGGNSLYQENTEMKFEQIKKITRTLDSVVKQKGFPKPDLIKMDVQGSELDVLRGSEETISHFPHLILELQFTEYDIGAPKHEEVINWLRNMGYNNHHCFCRTDVDGDFHFWKE